MRWHSTWLVAALFCSASSGAIAAGSEQELKQTIEQLESVKAKAEALSKEVKAAQSKMDEVQTKSVALAEKLHKIETEQLRKAKSLEVLQRELQTRQSALQARQDEVGKLMQGMIRMQRLPRQFVIARPGNADDLVRSASALDVTYRALSDSIRDIQNQMQELGKVREKVSDAQQQLEEEQASLEKQQSSLNGLLSERQQAYRSLHQDHEATRQRVGALSRQSQSLQELIGKLDKEESLFRQMGAPQSKPAAPAPEARTTVASLKPAARGHIIHRYGETMAGGSKRSGAVLRTATGAVVTTPQDGKVAFTGTFMDYGNVIIIQHDNDVHTVLAGFDKMMVEPGQKVRSGEPLGVMGATAKDAELYLELRKHSKPIDPSRWIGNVNLR